MPLVLSPVAAAYVDAVNHGNVAAYDALFAEDAIVDDAGREFRGRSAIKAWSDHDIFAANVSLEVVDAVDLDGESVITTKVDGKFDRTGLPDPLFIRHHFSVVGGKIVSLRCRLAE